MASTYVICSVSPVSLPPSSERAVSSEQNTYGPAKLFSPCVRPITRTRWLEISAVAPMPLMPRLAAERFDTIVCLNVLEHIEDDVTSLRSMRALLQPGGRLVLLVPALPALYGTLDEALGHFRRYRPAELAAKFTDAGFRLAHVEYFNLAGVLGWWLIGRVLRRRLIPRCALKWYDALVPLFRLETLMPWRIGQSLIAIGEVPS